MPAANNGHLAYDDTDTSLIVASHGTSQIHRVQLPGGEESVIAGSGIRGNVDGSAGEAQFSRPNGIAVSVTGDSVFVNSSVPTSNVGFPLNPSLLRLITGINSLPTDMNHSFETTIDDLIASYDQASSLLVVNFKLKQSKEMTLSIYSIDGKLVYTKQLGSIMAGEYSTKLPVRLNGRITRFVFAFKTTRIGIHTSSKIIFKKGS